MHLDLPTYLLFSLLFFSVLSEIIYGCTKTHLYKPVASKAVSLPIFSSILNLSEGIAHEVS